MNELLAEFLRSFTATNDWAAIMPEIMLGVLALGLLVAEMALPRTRHDLVVRLAIGGQVLILGLTIALGWRVHYPADGQSYFSGMIQQTDVTQIMRGFFLISSILVCYLGKLYLAKQRLARTEFFHLVIVSAAGMMLLVQSAHFIMLFVALEAVTVAFYVLVAYGRTSALSLEAGLKYLILGALSSSILLFGIVLLYGVAGNPEMSSYSADALNFNELKIFIGMHSDHLLVRVGAVLVVAGICFKIAAVPFQIWVPDVYQGAPTPVTAYLAIASKAAGFIILLKLLTGPLVGLSALLLPLLSVIAAASILFGNFAAVGQRNVKRLIGLSGIAHAGYLLVGVVAALTIPWALYAVIFYLATYLLAAFAVFAVMAHVSGAADADQARQGYENFARQRPFLSAVLTVGLGSLAGIPPLGGFIAKLFIFVAAYQAQLYILLGISVFGVVVSIYYYFGWLRVVYFSHPSDDATEPGGASLSVGDRIVLAILVVAIVLVGLFPAVLPIVQVSI